MNVVPSEEGKCPSCSRDAYQSYSIAEESNDSLQSLFGGPEIQLRDLGLTEKNELRNLLAKRVSPDAIDAFFVRCGFREADIVHVYRKYGLRRKHLAWVHSSTRIVRCIGCILVFLSIGGPIVTPTSVGFVVSLGLLAYGMAIIVTGDLRVFQQDPLPLTRFNNK